MPIEDIRNRILSQIEAASQQINEGFKDSQEYRLFWQAWLKECLRLLENGEIDLPQHAQRKSILEARGVQAVNLDTADGLTELVTMIKRVYDAQSPRRAVKGVDENEAVETAMGLVLPLKVYEILDRFWQRVDGELTQKFSGGNREGRFSPASSELKGEYSQALAAFARKSQLNIFRIQPDNWFLTTDQYPVDSDIPLFGDYCMIVDGGPTLAPAALTIRLMAENIIVFPYFHILGPVKPEDNYNTHPAIGMAYHLARVLGMKAMYLGELGQGKMNFEELRLKG